MPVETATYTHDLNVSLPAHTDGLNQTDSHLRLLKTTLQNTLPNLNAPVTATPAQLNAAGTAFSVPGAVVVPAAGASGGSVDIAGPTGSGALAMANVGVNGQPAGFQIFMNDATNSNTTVSLTLTRVGDLSTPNSVNSASIRKNGVELLPTGIICMWSGAANAIPAGWHLCDGSVGTPNLRDRFIVGAGTSYAVAQVGGATGVGVATDAQGAHSHTGITAGAGPFGMSGSSDVQGGHNHGGTTDNTVLSIAQIPPHSHGLAGFNMLNANGGAGGLQVGGFPIGENAANSEGGGAGHLHGIFFDGSHAHNIAVSNSPAHAHGIVVDGNHAHNVSVSTLPPFYALCFIMKL